MSSSSLFNKSLRVLLKGVHSLMKAGWFLRRPRTFGAHAVALTPAGRIVLVRLRYAEGWRLPGGGRQESEKPEHAVVRELREEIGMTSYGALQRACDLQESIDFKRDLASLLIVRDVQYQPPRWSLEVEEVLETEIDELPSDLSPQAATWIKAVFPNL